VTETIREIGLRRMTRYLESEGAHPSVAPVLALGIERILADLGVRLPNRPPLDDPNAISLAPPPTPGDAVAGAEAARAALAAHRGSERLAETTPPEPLPEFPGDPE
jgi:hypothetical protein